MSMPRPSSGFDRRSLARALIVAGAVAAAVLVMPTLPRENVLVLRLPPQSGRVCRLRIDWRNTLEKDVVGGVSLEILTSRPARVNYSFRAPPGDYQLTAAILRPRRNMDCKSELVALPMRDHRVRLEGGTTKISFSADAHP